MNATERALLAIGLIQRAADEPRKFALELRHGGYLSWEQKEARAMSALEHLTDLFDHAPDLEWWRDYHLLTGQHMILWEEGWEPGECKAAYLADDPKWEPLDEVNAPPQSLESHRPPERQRAKGKLAKKKARKRKK